LFKVSPYLRLVDVPLPRPYASTLLDALILVLSPGWPFCMSQWLAWIGRLPKVAEHKRKLSTSPTNSRLHLPMPTLLLRTIFAIFG